MNLAASPLAQRIWCLILMAMLSLPASAATVFVTQSSDESGNLGTLRDAINNRVSPGDTIVIQVNRIVLDGPLTIPVDNITIDGGGAPNGNNTLLRPADGIGSPIIVRGDGVTLQNLRVRDIELFVDPENGVGIVDDFSLLDSRLRGDTQLSMSNVNGCTIQGNDIRTRLDDAVTLFQSESCRINNNAIRARDFAINDLESADLRLDGNVITGPGWMLLSTETATVTGNRRERRGGIDLDGAVPEGLIRAEGNTAPWMIVERSNVQIIRNTLGSTDGTSTGRRNVLRVFNETPAAAGPPGPVIVRNNIINGGVNGLFYRGAGATAGTASITDNNIRYCSRRGLVVGSVQRLEITRNVITQCGSFDRGQGMNLRGPVYEQLTVDDNDVSRINGVGIKVRPPVADGTVLLTNNRVLTNDSHGVVLRPEVSMPEPPPSGEDDPEPEEPGDSSETPGPVMLENNQIDGNGGHGVVARDGARGAISGGRIQDNNRDGVFVAAGALVEIGGVSFADNGGAGIDVAPAGITANDQDKAANNNIDWPEALTLTSLSRQLTGLAAPDAAIDVYVAEAEPRVGNPANGEGFLHLGTVLAGPDGRFTFPGTGELTCDSGSYLTATATLGDATSWTSEFSENLACEFPDPDTTDTDGDGVVDSQDACPNTPPGEMVDDSGCTTMTGNQPPVAVVSDPGEVPVGETVTFDASGSSDPDGDALSYDWEVSSAPAGSTATLSNAATANPSFTPDILGTYTFIATCSDGEFTDSVVVVLYAVEIIPDQPPTAAIADPGPANVGDTVTLDGSGSSDPDGDEISFFWFFVETPADSEATLSSEDTPTTSYVPDVAGEYEVRLRVDSNGLSDEAARRDSWEIPNEAPEVVIDAPEGIVPTEAIVYLDAAGSTDPDGDGLDFAWELIERPSGSSATLTATDEAIAGLVPDVIGDYRARLVVSDGEIGVLAEATIRAGTFIYFDLSTIQCRSADCAFETDGSAGSCTNCRGVFDDGTVHECTAPDSSLTISGPGELSANNCASMSSPGTQTDCSQAMCRHVQDGGSSCSGAAGTCATTDDEGEPLAACTGGPCTLFLTADVVSNLINTSAINQATVTTTSSDGDGTFSYSLSGAALGGFTGWTAATSDGVGDQQGILLFGSSDDLTLTQEDQPQWSTLSNCSIDGATTIGEAVVEFGAGLVAADASCTFANTAFPDADGDGIPDDIDRCIDAAGPDGEECPEILSNDDVTLYCNNPLTCSLLDFVGDCTDCTMVQNDSNIAMGCPLGATCVTREPGVVECQGNCSVTSAEFEADCGANTVCSVEADFRCQSDANGEGCNGATSDGQTIGCEPGTPCNIRVFENALQVPGSTEYLQTRKRTQGTGGLAGQFAFEERVIPLFGEIPGAGDDGGLDDLFFVATNNEGESTSLHRSYYNSTISRVYVNEDRFNEDTTPGFTFVGSSCTTDGTLLDGDWFVVLDGGSGSCTFVNEKDDVPTGDPQPIPFGGTQGEEITEFAGDFFSGMGTGVAAGIIGMGTATGAIIFDAETEALQQIGDRSTSFLNDFQPAIGIVGKVSSTIRGGGALISYGPNGTLTRSWDPDTGNLGFAQLGFDSVTQAVHLNGDVEDPTVLLANSSRNEIRAIVDDDNPSSDGWRTQTVIRSETLQDIPGTLVSTYSSAVGNLACSQPCDGVGAPMPTGCQPEMDQVITDNPFCGDFWTPSCASAYNTLTGGFCNLPAGERQVNFGGAVLVVHNNGPSLPGTVSIADPGNNFFGRADVIGGTGMDPRRIDCDGERCVISNNASSSVTLLSWDGLLSASIVAEIPVDPGPFGVYTRAVDGNQEVLTTGSLSNTWQRLLLDPEGNVLSNESFPVPASCQSPRFIRRLEDGPTILISCYDSNNYWRVQDPR